MKNKILSVTAAFVVLASAYRCLAADTNTNAAAADTNAAGDLKDLIMRINASIQAGHITEADQAENIKTFDALLVKYKGETNDDVAHILFMKATLYTQVFTNDAKALELMRQLERDFPGTAFAKRAEPMIVNLSLQAGSKFPDFAETDADGKPLSVANYKGKVVMVDFWATWCGPCVHEVPNVVAAYKKYHDKGFEIIGVSLDRAGDLDKMKSFTKDNEMPWPQYFDGGFWTNKLVLKYGVYMIPATFLLDGTGTILARDLHGPDLDPAIAKALAAQ